MRRVLITIAAGLTILAFVPATAAARKHHRHRHHAHAQVVRHRFHGRVVRNHRVHFGRFASAPTSTPSSGAGTVAPFNSGTGLLTIMLNDGSSVSGTVTGDTEIECSSSGSSTTFQGDDESSGGDNGGATSGDDDQGDQGDQGDEGDQGQTCSTADLKTGAPVIAAELAFTSSGTVWEKLELG